MRVSLRSDLPEEVRQIQHRARLSTIWRAVVASGLVLVLSLLFGATLGLTSQGRDIALVTVSAGEFSSLACFTALLIALGANNFASTLLLVASSNDRELHRSISLPRVEFTAHLLSQLPAGLTLLVYLSLTTLGSNGSDVAPPQPLFGVLAALIAGGATYAISRFIEARAMRKFVSAHARYFILDRTFRDWYRIIAIAFIVVISIVLLALSDLQRALGSAAVLLLAINAYLIVLTTISRWLRTWSIPLLPVLMILPVMAGLIGSETHHVRSIALEEPRSIAEAHAARWLDAAVQRADLASNDDARVPVVVVLAEGGGIRAAQFSSQLLNAVSRHSTTDFAEDIYVLSGVSGGSLGVATFLASETAETAEDGKNQLTSFYQTDHFTPLLSALLMLDLPSRFVPLEPFSGVLHLFTDGDDRANLPDRSDTFERSFEQAWCMSMGMPTHNGQQCSDENGRAANNPMSIGIEDLAERGGAGAVAPIVLFSTVRANDGQLGVVSNVSFLEPTPLGSQSTTLQDLLPVQKEEAARTLPASAAAHVSARFPFANPPAVVDTIGDQGTHRLRYVDGAYMDNSGALAALEALHHLFELAEDRGIRDRLHVQVVHIYARDLIEAQSDFGESSEVFAQTLTPIQAVAAARNKIGLSPIRSLCAALINDSARSGDCQYLDGLRVSLEQGLAPSEELTAGNRSVVTQFDNRIGSDAFTWLSVPLDASVDPTSPRYAPLGWLLSPSSRQYVEDEAEELGIYLADTLDGVNQWQLGQP